MTEHLPDLQLEISVTARTSDGSPMAAYIKFRQGKVARTDEVETDTLLAHYDTFGNLLGLEILAPVRVNLLLKQVSDESLRPTFRAFVRANVPKGLLRAA